ncbi:hypothetical protein ANCCEY_14415 [Ancylostoma ceylanicum]|uniref:Spondin domain-containing protein n=1 Tax=Ancylostoma ceylanicum TaxID=53326 RepID=A0A0D6L5K6_9BILA|nr:hypothetical protein ANCCEY_14415 [Ancylostoma ceylanicum]
MHSLGTLLLVVSLLLGVASADGVTAYVVDETPSPPFYNPWKPVSEVSSSIPEPCSCLSQSGFYRKINTLIVVRTSLPARSLQAPLRCGVCQQIPLLGRTAAEEIATASSSLIF